MPEYYLLSHGVRFCRFASLEEAKAAALKWGCQIGTYTYEEIAWLDSPERESQLREASNFYSIPCRFTP